MQELIIVTRIFSGIESALVSGHWKHSGSPAYYYFIRQLDLSEDFTYKLYFLSPNVIGDNKQGKVLFDNLNVVANVVPYYSIPLSKHLPILKKVEFFYNKVRQYMFVITQNYSSRFYYIDRDNILLSFILLVISRSNTVITRLLGVPPGLYQHLTHRNNVYSKIIKWVFNNNRSYFICTNDGSFAEATKEKVKNDRFYLLFNGVDKGPIFKPKTVSRKERNEILTISYISRIDLVKGHINFIKSLRKSKIKDKLQVYIIGDGSLKEQCQSLVKNYGLEDVVMFTGRITHRKAMKYLYDSDMFIAINYDGSFGNGVLEAANMGIPIVTLAHKSFPAKKYPFFEFIENDGEIDKHLEKFIEKFFYSESLQKLMSRNSVKFSDSYLLNWNDRIDIELDIISSICEKKVDR
jgi:glycosyltransferase involved in cell wall biosynthesis